MHRTTPLGSATLNFANPTQRSIEQYLVHWVDAETITNVGAGTGSYEPLEKFVVAVEPSITMIGQRRSNSAPVIQASALALPFGTGSFDAAMAVLTVHHWQDKALGLRELRRVSRNRVVILTWDPSWLWSDFWLNDYLPEILDYDRPIFPTLVEFEAALGSIEVIEVPIPHDCTDGFMCAYWRRPAAYLDSNIRSAISTFSKLGDITKALEKLSRDLKSGDWRTRYGDILKRTEFDLGYRLIVAS